MRLRRALSWFYSLALWAQIAAGAVIASIGGLQKADIPDLRLKAPGLAGLFDYLTALQSNAWWVLPVLAILAGILGLLRKHLGSPWLWGAVHQHLDVIRELAFNLQPNDAVHHHRVTLFKHVPWAWCLRKWPWSGWLVAVERSGHTTQNSIAFFRAPDNPDHAEGVAGMTWARNGTVAVSKLPQLTAQSTDEELKAYSAAAGVSVEWLRRRLPQAQSICGIPVEVKGRLWGVIVLDSRSPTGLAEGGQVMYKPASKLLAKLLERL